MDVAGSIWCYVLCIEPREERKLVTPFFFVVQSCSCDIHPRFRVGTHRRGHKKVIVILPYERLSKIFEVVGSTKR